MTARESIFILLLALLVVTGNAWAASPTDEVRSHVDRVLAMLEDPTLHPHERDAAARKAAADAFQLSEMARRSLGRQATVLTTAQRREFVQGFTGLLSDVYVRVISRYLGPTKVARLRGEIEYGSASITGDYATVPMTFRRRGHALPIEVRMLRHGSRWLVHDLVIREVSLVDNYRAQIHRVLQRESYPRLAQLIGERRAELARRPVPALPTQVAAR